MLDIVSLGLSLLKDEVFLSLELEFYPSPYAKYSLSLSLSAKHGYIIGLDKDFL